MSSFYPPGIGFNPTGVNGTLNNASVVLGRNGDVTWEAIGFGAEGRPDFLESVYLNLTKTTAGGSTRLASISFSASGVESIVNAAANPTLAGRAALNFQIREVLVCETGVTKKMMILASATYPTGVS